MLTKLSRIDLGDREAVYYCLRCGATYAHRIPGCVECGARHMERRSQIVDCLHRSAPHEDPAEFDAMALVPLPGEDVERSLPAIVAGLQEEGYARLVVDGEGRPVEEPEWEPGLMIYVPEDEEMMIRERIAHWTATPDGMESSSTDEQRSVALVGSSDQVEIALIRELLDEAGISYTTDLDPTHLAGAFGHTPSTIRFFVDSCDQQRADELLDQLEAGGEEEPSPAEVGVDPAAVGDDPGTAPVEDPPSKEPASRGFRLVRVARWMLVIQGVTLLMIGPAVMATGEPALMMAPLIGLLLIGTAIYAGSQPRKALGIGLLLQASVTAIGVALAEFTGILLGPSLFLAVLLILAYRASDPLECGP